MTGLVARLRRRTSSGAFIPEIDGLRFIAIALVVLFHLSGYLLAQPQAYAGNPQGEWLAQVAAHGNYGVELFFIISGFILGMPFAAQHLQGAARIPLRRYYLRRITRLEPPYLLTLLGFFLIWVVVYQRGFRTELPHLLASSVYLHNLVYGQMSTINGVAWTLEIEVQFYMLAPFLAAALFSIRPATVRRGLVVALCLAALAAQLRWVQPQGRIALTLLAFVQFFLLGLLLADVYLAGGLAPAARPARWDLLSLGGWPLLALLWCSPATWAALAWPFLAALLFAAGFKGRFGARFLRHPWITAIGGMCYTIYLLHYPIVSAAARFTRRLLLTRVYSVNLLLQLLLVSVPVLLFCSLFFVAVERPCMDRDWPRKLARRVRGFVRPAAAPPASNLEAA